MEATPSAAFALWASEDTDFGLQCSFMKILVAIKRVSAPEQRVSTGPGGRIDENGLSFTVNPFDAIALEEALRIGERGQQAVEIIAVSIGRENCEEQLRTALAMGADRALRVGVNEPLDPWNVALTLAALVRRENANLVLMGKQAIDDDSNQAGQFLAAMLEWPQATFASKIEMEAVPTPTTARVDRETDAGIETVSVKLPAVITADLRLNEPRYPSLPSIIKARKKPIEFIAAEELGVTLAPRVELVRLEIASSERTCVRVKDVAELVHRLRHEAKVV
jgi:electron transfer flavoprotein beta subunit